MKKSGENGGEETGKIGVKVRGAVKGRVRRKFVFEGFDRSIVFLIIFLLGVASYFIFYYNDVCDGFECFKESMEKCEKVEYINEAPEASWGYTIIGKTGGSCDVGVKLLLAKEGELGVDDLVGYDMICTYPAGFGTYPEKDLGKCHGRLKEELQQIIINKLHEYIIENLGKIDEELNAV